MAAWVAGVTLVSYVLMYTPLKTRTSLSTLVGAIPGALPPVIGWTAAHGSITLPAIVLFGIVFFWQMPHFLAIAWMYRADYARAGIQMLPGVDPDGRRTSQQALLYSAALWPVSLMPLAVGLAGPFYGAIATILGLLFIWLCFRFTQERSHQNARRLFLFSITYLAGPVGGAGDRPGVAVTIGDLPALNATLNGLSGDLHRHRLRADPARRARAAQALHARGAGDLVGVSRQLRHLPREYRLAAVPWHRRSSGWSTSPS